MYCFLSGFTAKLAGTEIGVKEPQPTFSTCFGAPFLPQRPAVYARLLGKKLDRHSATVWLVNTGWTGGPFGEGQRMPIHATRALLHAALSGELNDSSSSAVTACSGSTCRRGPRGRGGASRSPLDMERSGGLRREVPGARGDVPGEFREVRGRCRRGGGRSRAGGLSRTRAALVAVRVSPVKAAETPAFAGAAPAFALDGLTGRLRSGIR